MDRSTYIGSIAHFCEHQVGQVSINYAEFNCSWWQLSPRSSSWSLSHHGGGPGRVEQLTAGVDTQGTLSTVGWAGPLTSGD